MGLLIDGKWSTTWYDTDKTEGRFVRETASFRNWITPDGIAGPTGELVFLQKVGAIIYMYRMPVHGRIAQ